MIDWAQHSSFIPASFFRNSRRCHYRQTGKRLPIVTGWLTLFLFSATGLLLAQEPPNPDSSLITSKKESAFLRNLDTLRDARINMNRAQLTPFIAPSYSPEMEATLTAGGLFTFSLQPKDPLLERSSIPFSIGYSTNKSLQISARANLFGKGDRFRLSGEFWLKNMPDHYWGIGYRNARAVAKSDSTTRYHRNWTRLYTKVVYQFFPGYFAGGILDVDYTRVKDLNPRMAGLPEIQAVGNRVRNAGLGLVVQYDSRDMPVCAYEGWLLDFSAVAYGPRLGGQYNYQTVELDYRRYFPLGHRRTIAMQVRTKTIFGDVPWPELSQLGTPFDLRGYTWGQFRDNTLLFSIFEYRHMLKRRTLNKRGNYDSRFGFVAWAATGSVGLNYGDLTYWLPNAGLGLRFETQPRMNVRADVGWGVEGMAFYLNFNEAF